MITGTDIDQFSQNPEAELKLHYNDKFKKVLNDTIKRGEIVTINQIDFKVLSVGNKFLHLQLVPGQEGWGK